MISDKEALLHTETNHLNFDTSLCMP